MTAIDVTVQNLVVDSTNVVRLRSLRNELTKLYLADATVTGTLKNSSNTDVVGAVDLDMDYVAASGDIPAEYRATLSHLLGLVDQDTYTFVVLAITSNTLSRRVFNIPCIAVKG